MFRRQLIELLLDHPMSVPQIARAVDEPVKDVSQDLEHLRLSLRHGEFEMLVTPAECRKCEFEFSTEKLRRPSKCPKCRSTWIYEPLIEIRKRFACA
jgi:transcriptional regulator